MYNRILFYHMQTLAKHVCPWSMNITVHTCPYPTYSSQFKSCNAILHWKLANLFSHYMQHESLVWCSLDDCLSLGSQYPLVKLQINKWSSVFYQVCFSWSCPIMPGWGRASWQFCTWSCAWRLVDCWSAVRRVAVSSGSIGLPVKGQSRMSLEIQGSPMWRLRTRFFAQFIFVVKIWTIVDQIQDVIAIGPWYFWFSHSFNCPRIFSQSL